MSDELGTVLVSNPLESTPEGLFRMDRLRRRADAERRELERTLTPEALDALERAELELERTVLGV